MSDEQQAAELVQAIVESVRDPHERNFQQAVVCHVADFLAKLRGEQDELGAAGGATSSRQPVLAGIGEAAPVSPAQPQPEKRMPTEPTDEQWSFARSILYGCMGHLGISVMADAAVNSVASRIAEREALAAVKERKM